MTEPVKRILVLADFACASGFAQVSQNVISQVLREKDFNYQIDIVAINYHGLPNDWQNIFPKVRLFPAITTSQGDLFGRQGFLSLLSSGAYDLVWILQDTFIVESFAEKMLEIRKALFENNRKTFKIIYYFPIDATPKENWVTKSVSIVDYPVAYTQYGYDECVAIDPKLKDRLKIINHGVDTEAFHPLPKDEVLKFRHDYFEGMADDKFLIVNVNRNQPRKDTARTLQAFAILKKQVPEAMLYMHMKHDDVAYDLREVGRLYDLQMGVDFLVPHDFSENSGVEIGVMNLIYNSADCIVSTTLGEGWGLSSSEAMATKTPAVFPNNTALKEILGDGRGLLVESGKTINDWFVLGSDNERLRPLTNVIDLVNKLKWLRDNKNSQEVTDMVEKAYKQAVECWDWKVIGQQWRDLFKTVLSTKEVKVGRNDWCPGCLKDGTQIKYKKCTIHYGGR